MSALRRYEEKRRKNRYIMPTLELQRIIFHLECRKNYKVIYNAGRMKKRKKKKRKTRNMYWKITFRARNTGMARALVY